MSKKIIKKESERDAWEMLEHESVKDYECFRYYMRLPTRGKIHEVATFFGYTSPDFLYHISQRHDWVGRKKEWLAHLNKIAIEETEKVFKEMVRRHAANAMLNESALMIPVKVFAKKVQSVGTSELEALSLKELMKYVFESARLHPATLQSERLGRGQATEINKTEMIVEQVHIVLPSLEAEEE